MAKVKQVGIGLVVALVVTIAGLAGPVRPAVADINEAPPGSEAYRSFATGGGHVCALQQDGAVKCWGNNNLGQLGLGDTNIRGDQPGEMGGALPVVDLGAGRTATALAGGSIHTCAILDTGAVKCWGHNGAGRLGLGDTATRGDGPNEMGDNLLAVNLGNGRTAVAITAGTFHTCALLDTGAVKCWGQNNLGQLGLGDMADRGDGPNEMGDNLLAVNLGSGRTATAVTAGLAHTCALLDTGAVKCWGQNVVGQLGQGDTAVRGDNIGDMGDPLPPINLGAGRTATAITAGQQHTCARLDNATLKCWGSGVALGLGAASHRGDGPNEMGDNLPPVPLGTGRTVDAVSAGVSFSCALLDDATTKCWGQNQFGQLGLGDTQFRGDHPNEMGDLLPTVDLGVGRSVAAVQVGDSTGCALLDDGDIKCWGPGGAGVSGAGDTVTRGDGPNEMGDALPVAFTLVPRVAVSMTVDQASVVAGQDIDYHVTVVNTGGVRLTSVRVHAPDVPDCAGPVAPMGLGTIATVHCSFTTTAADAPLMTNQVHVTSAQGATALSGTRRTRVDPVVLRPDGLVRRGAGLFAGDGTYSGTGAGQTRTATVPNLGTATFTARVQNDGNVTDDLVLRGQPTTSRYTVTYRDGTTNVTAQVVAGTFVVADLGPGATRDITMVVKARPGTPVGNRINRTLTATSQASPTTKDTVKVTVTRR